MVDALPDTLFSYPGMGPIQGALWLAVPLVTNLCCPYTSLLRNTSLGNVAELFVHFSFLMFAPV